MTKAEQMRRLQDENNALKTEVEQLKLKLKEVYDRDKNYLGDALPAKYAKKSG